MASTAQTTVHRGHHLRLAVTAGRYTTFAPPGARVVVPFDINNRGQIVRAAYRDPTATAGRGLCWTGAPGVRSPRSTFPTFTVVSPITQMVDLSIIRQ
jgi:hypothetical protein